MAEDSEQAGQHPPMGQLSYRDHQRREKNKVFIVELFHIVNTPNFIHKSKDLTKSFRIVASAKGAPSPVYLTCTSEATAGGGFSSLKTIVQSNFTTL